MCNSIQQIEHLYINFKTFIPKCFRRRVWETRHSGVTGWELLSHFSDVWCSSLLQLTRSSSWQLASLFRCQISPQRMYVYDICMYVLCICLYLCTEVYVFVCTYFCMQVCMSSCVRANHENINSYHTISHNRLQD